MSQKTTGARLAFSNRKKEEFLLNHVSLLLYQSFMIKNTAKIAPAMLINRVVWLRTGIIRPIPATARMILFAGPNLLNKKPERAALSTKQPKSAVLTASVIPPADPLKSRPGKKINRKGTI